MKKEYDFSNGVRGKFYEGYKKMKSIIKIKEVPDWIKNSLIFEAKTGSHSYGCATENSDLDLNGICVPSLDILFPYKTINYIYGFGTPPQKFENYQKNHLDGVDITVYNIVKFFHLCMNNNPNIVDILFSPEHCFTFLTPVGKHLIKNKEIFLSKKCYITFCGYAKSQLRKLNKVVINRPKRKKLIKDFGYDTKFAYHLVRLLSECKQILSEGTLILDKEKELYKEIRSGKWSEKEIIDFFNFHSHQLEVIYNKSTLPEKANEEKIKKLLIDCIEMFHGVNV